MFCVSTLSHILWKMLGWILDVERMDFQMNLRSMDKRILLGWSSCLEHQSGAIKAGDYNLKVMSPTSQIQRLLESKDITWCFSMCCVMHNLSKEMCICIEMWNYACFFLLFLLYWAKATSCVSTSIFLVSVVGQLKFYRFKLGYRCCYANG